MARITVEDCLRRSPTASSLCWPQLTVRACSAKATPQKSKAATQAQSPLREIAQGKVGLEMLKKVPG